MRQCLQSLAAALLSHRACAGRALYSRDTLRLPERTTESAHVTTHHNFRRQARLALRPRIHLIPRHAILACYVDIQVLIIFFFIILSSSCEASERARPSSRESCSFRLAWLRLKVPMTTTMIHLRYRLQLGHIAFQTSRSCHSCSPTNDRQLSLQAESIQRVDTSPIDLLLTTGRAWCTW
jgi:hypothetical protein